MNGPLANVKSQITLNVRATYSNPPAHGGRIVDLVLKDDALFDEWRGNIKTMAHRIIGELSSTKVPKLLSALYSKNGHVIVQAKMDAD